MPLLLLPAPRQAGKACSASCVLFSYSCKNSFDLTDESFAWTFFTTCNFWYQLKSLTIPEAIRHPTRETQEHRVTNTHFAAAPSAYGCSCRLCDYLGRMVLLKKTTPIKFLCWCLLWFAKRRDLVAFWRYKHTPQWRRSRCARSFLHSRRSNSNFELVIVSRIPQIRLKKSVTEILLRRFCDRILLRRFCDRILSRRFCDRNSHTL